MTQSNSALAQFFNGLEMDVEELADLQLQEYLLQEKMVLLIQQSSVAEKLGEKLDNLIQNLLIGKLAVSDTVSSYILYKMKAELKDKQLPAVLTRVDAERQYEKDQDFIYPVGLALLFFLLTCFGFIRIGILKGVILGFLGWGGSTWYVTSKWRYDLKKNPAVLEKTANVLTEWIVQCRDYPSAIEADAKRWKARQDRPQITVRR